MTRCPYVVMAIAFVTFVMTACTPPPPPAPGTAWQQWTAEHVQVIEFHATPGQGCDRFVGGDHADGYRILLDRDCVNAPGWLAIDPTLPGFLVAHSYAHAAAVELGEGVGEPIAQTIAAIVSGHCVDLGPDYPCPTQDEMDRVEAEMVTAGMWD